MEEIVRFLRRHIPNIIGITVCAVAAWILVTGLDNIIDNGIALTSKAFGKIASVQENPYYDARCEEPLKATYGSVRILVIESRCEIYQSISKRVFYGYSLTMINDSKDTIVVELGGGALKNSPFRQNKWGNRTFYELAPCSLLTRGVVSASAPVGSGIRVTTYVGVGRDMEGSAGVYFPRDHRSFFVLPDSIELLQKDRALSTACR